MNTYEKADPDDEYIVPSDVIAESEVLSMRYQNLIISLGYRDRVLLLSGNVQELAALLVAFVCFCAWILVAAILFGFVRVQLLASVEDFLPAFLVVTAYAFFSVLRHVTLRRELLRRAVAGRQSYDQVRSSALAIIEGGSKEKSS